MKRVVTGFVFLLLSLVLAWFLREPLMQGLLIPMLFGALKVGQLINTVPQLVWWILLIILSFTLFFTKINLPSVRFLKRKAVFSPRGRMDVIESLIKESDKGSTYSGQQLALLLINLYLKRNNREEISIHKIQSELDKGNLPPELAEYAASQFKTARRRKENMAGRLSLEKAVRYLKEGESL